MKDELAPNQLLLLWDLALRGGMALQPEVTYKNISKDRNELERRKFLSVIKKPRPYRLELKEEGWNELSRHASVLHKGKKRPSRERAIIELLLNTLQNYASKKNVGVGEILRPSEPDEKEIEVRRKIRRAFFEIAGTPPQDSVRLSALRAKLHDVPRKQLDDALLHMKRTYEINLMNLDNPRDIKAEESATLHDGNRQFHVLWIQQ